MASVPAPSSRLRDAGSSRAATTTTTGGGQRRRPPLPRSSIVAAAGDSKPHADSSSTRASRLPLPPHDSERRDRGSEASTSSSSLRDSQRWHRRLPELGTAVASAALAVVALSASTLTFASVVVAPPPASAAAAAEAPALSAASNRTVPVDRAWLEGLVIEDTRAK